MNQEEVKYYRMFIAVKNTMENNTSIWSGNPKFAETKTNFDSEVKAISIIDKEASLNTKGQTRDKNQIRSAVEQKTLMLSGALTAHASLTKNETLKGTLITSKSGLERLKETELVTYASIMADTIVPLQHTFTSDYGVTESEVEDFQTTLDEYAPLVGVTRQRQAKINATKKTLRGHVDEANRLLREVIDPLLLRYKFTNAEFYNEYQQSRTIVD